MANGKISRKNPSTIPSPVGNYSHITKIPREAELFVTSGQIGIDSNGDIPSKFNKQVSNTLKHYWELYRQLTTIHLPN